MDHPAKEPAAGCVDGQIPGGRFAPVTIDVYPGRSSGPRRSSGRTVRTLGARCAYAWVFARKCRGRYFVEQKNTGSPYARGAGKVATVVLSGSACGTRSASI